MKKIFFAWVFIFASLCANTQQNKPQILLEPANWEFERFELPPSFAPQITYKGVEEIRFAPGMFNKDSANYFSYVFVAQIDKITPISETEIKNYLTWYFRGLCSSTAKERKMVIDSTKISATVKKRTVAPGTASAYDATINVFGVFADGAPVKLNIEAGVVNNPTTKKTFLFFLASPRDKKEPIWDDLHEISKHGVENAKR